ncbi:MAG: inorganic phosphate transporter [Gammaproteobacteria bacterium]|jgi:PiT family inorganic phosphate transporter|nr:inorganic phosphate transporter [Gammaproteobacteria bacterium]
MDTATIFLVLAGVLGLFMAWGIGANDVANAMATSVGSRALTVRQAVIIAAIFEFAGAYLAGGQVTATVRKGIIDSGEFCVGCTATPDTLVVGMLAALMAAACWLYVASHRGWPVSTTHSIVGAIVGFAWVGVGSDAVQWTKVGTIALSWLFSPLVAGFFAFAIFSSIQRLILDTENPFRNTQKFGPYYLFVVGFVIAMVTIRKGLKHLGLGVGPGETVAYAIVAGVVIALMGALLVRRISPDPGVDRDFHFASVERVFALLMIFTASAMAFAHGSNDVANAVGPVAAVVSIVKQGSVMQQSALPAWVLLLGAAGIVLGLSTFGYRVIRTVGRKITELTPSRGFSAEIAAASTVVFASYTGMPISTTHTLVGAVLGVGFARGIAALNLRVVGGIFMSWLITLPVGAALAIGFFYLLKALLL